MMVIVIVWLWVMLAHGAAGVEYEDTNRDEMRLHMLMMIMVVMVGMMTMVRMMMRITSISMVI